MTGEERDAATADLWRFYDEHATQARQHEGLRATVTSTLVAIASAVLGLVGVGGIDRADLPAGFAIVLLGVVGVALSLKHYERNRMHTKVMGRVRQEIDALRRGGGPAASTDKIRADAVEKHEKELAVLTPRKRGMRPHSPLPRLRLHLLWACLPIGVGSLGVGVLALVLAAPSR